MDQQIIFQDATGQELTTADLELSGTTDWQVAGNSSIPEKANELCIRGRQAGAVGDYEQAIEFFEQAHRMAPDWPYPLYDIAWTYLLLEDDVKAEQYYALVDELAPRGFFATKTALDCLRRIRAGELAPGAYTILVQLEAFPDGTEKARLLEIILEQLPEFPALWKQLALLREDDQSRLEAIARGLAGGPDAETKGMLLIHKAMILSNQGQQDEAISILRQLALDPQATLATEYMAKVVLAILLKKDTGLVPEEGQKASDRTEEQYEAAIEAFQRVLELDPQDTRAWHNLAITYLDQGRYEEAVEALQQVVELDPEAVSAWYNLGVVYRAQARFEAASAAFQRAIEIEPKQPALWYELGTVYHAQKQYEAAARAYQQVIELDPQNADPWKALGGIYLAQEQYEQARQAYQRAIELAPEDAYAWYELGNVYNAQEQPDQGDQAFRRARELAVQDPFSWHGLSSFYAIQERFEAVLDVYQWTIKLAPQEAHLWKRLGVLYSVQGRDEEALAAFQQVTELDPQDADAWYRLGIFYNTQRRYEEALEAFQQATELDPQDPDAWYMLGGMYCTPRQFEQALKAFQQAIELDGEFAAAWHKLGAIHRDQGRYQEAIKAYQRTMELDPDPYHHTMLGALYELAGELEKALAEHRLAVELLPDRAVSRSSLASVLRKLGHEAEAEEHLALARELMADEGSYTQACIEAISGNIEAALEHLTQALAQFPNDRAWARRDPDFASLHGDPRFEALVRTE